MQRLPPWVSVEVAVGIPAAIRNAVGVLACHPPGGDVLVHREHAAGIPA